MQIKSIVVGAAGLLAASSAFAADLPGAPEPVDYVRVCDAYGMGYFYVPGTETCLRISSRVRADFNVWGSDKGYDGNYGWGTRETNGISTRARGYLYMDSRTNTEFGLLRMYTEMYTTIDSNAAGAGSNALTLDNAYIQFGGLTAGRGQSFYDFFTGYNYAARIGGSYSDQKTNLLGYTYGFGSGFSATLALEDPTFRNQGIATYSTAIGVPVAPGTNLYNYGGVRAPDVVGAVRVDQGWGSAQLSGAIHNVYSDSPQVGSSLGWAVQGGVEFNIPQAGPSTSVALQGAFGQGALSYISGGAVAPVGINNDVFYNGSAVDATVNAASNNLNLTTAWSISGGVTHAWNPQWKSNLTASYLDAQVDGSQSTLIGDFSNIDVAGNLVYSPVAGLELGGEVEYKYVDRQWQSDVNGLVGIFRVQKTF